MPTLQERLDHDLTAAAKSRDAFRLGVIRLLKSAVKYREIELGSTLDDASVIQVIGTQIKQRRDSTEQYTKANRLDLAEKEVREIAVLQTYLPQALTAEELGALVDAAVAEVGAKTPKEMGAVMKVLQPRIAGRAEGKQVADAVKARLTPK
jgi:uncharacterized protein YqeY